MATPISLGRPFPRSTRNKATGSLRSFTCLRISKAAAPESARRTRKRPPYCCLRSRSMARRTSESSSAVRITGLVAAGIDSFILCINLQLLLLRGFLRERMIPPFTMSDCTKRLPLLLALADCLSWIAKSEDRQDFDLFGNVQHRIDMLEIIEADPV